MDGEPKASRREIERLRRCMNDLISVQALPAIWTGLGANEIIDTLLDVLTRLLQLDFACAQVNESRYSPRIEAVVLPTGHDAAHRIHDRGKLALWLKGDIPATAQVVENPIAPGEISIAPLRMGLREEVGFVAAASRRTDFPTELEMIVLRVAANQAVIGMQEAPFAKRAEERLRHSEAQLAEGQRLSHSGSWGWNVSSGELVLSQETFRILGFDPEQPAPTFETAMERLHPDDYEPVVRLLQSAVSERKNYEFEARLVLPDRSMRYLHCVGGPSLNSPSGLEFVGTILDITERKRAEETLAMAQAQLAHMARVTTMGELAASIAHEVNQPLAAVITNGSACLRWLGSAEPNLEEARAAVNRIVGEANRASQVVARIRAFMMNTRPSSTIVHMNDVIREVVALMRHQMMRDEVSVRCELAENLNDTHGDPIQLQQVAVNLIVNATEAMRTVEGPRQLVLSTENRNSEEILVRVKDMGVGIDPRISEQLFMPFVSSKPGGMGMGLAISRSIVEAHGGRLWAAANADQGTTFQFSIPASASLAV
ncbi:MAG: hypothetical protein JWP63_974 [Candidatus Solibacter sp.]|nr:hypothetical protein [Candidatus Solibacter sp.]